MCRLTACFVASGLALAAALGGCTRPIGPPAASAATQRWVRFTDPVEHAFSLEAPAGWVVEGGSRRVSANDVRTGVVARPPDGSMELFFGDSDTPAFTLPNAALSAAGFRDGSTFSPGQGQTLVVADYRAGEAFAAGWGAQRLGRGCAAPRLTASRPLPQADEAMDAAYAQGGVQTSIHAGEAKFTCTWNGGTGAGYVFAATEMAEGGDRERWGATALAGFAARADRSREAAQVLSRLAASFTLDPEWAARQQGLSSNSPGVVSSTNAAVSRSVSQAWSNLAAESAQPSPRAKS